MWTFGGKRHLVEGHAIVAESVRHRTAGREAFSRHSWVWFVLGPTHRSVHLEGDELLAKYLLELGLTVTGPGETVALRADARVLVTSAQRTDASGLADLLLRVQSERLIAVALGGGQSSPPTPTGALVRTLELAGSLRNAASTALSGRRIGKQMTAAGLSVRVIPTGDRSRRHGVGRGGWVSRLRVPIGWIVAGTPGKGQVSVVEAVVAEAAGTLGQSLSIHRADVLESGKIMLLLADRDGDTFFMHVAAGRVGARLEASRRQIAELIARRPPEELRARIIEPLAFGEVGPVTYVVERKARGSHPALMTDRRSREALDFLIGLHRLGRSTETATKSLLFESVDQQIDSLSRHLGPRQQETLAELRMRLTPALERVPPGLRHGDYWSGNLLFDGDQLTAVLDWEWASSNTVPLFDVFDLASTAMPRDRRRSFGERFVHVLLPLLHTGKHPYLDAYLVEQDLVGLGEDHETLATLVSAYWLDWVSRELGASPDHEVADEWHTTNLYRPLDRITAAFAHPNELRATPGRR